VNSEQLADNPHPHPSLKLRRTRPTLSPGEREKERGGPSNIPLQRERVIEDRVRGTLI